MRSAAYGFGLRRDAVEAGPAEPEETVGPA